MGDDPRMFYDSSKEWNKIVIDFSFDQELVDLVKEITASYFYSDKRLWMCPLPSLPEAVDLLEPKDFHFEKGLKEKIPEAKKERKKGWKRVFDSTRQEGFLVTFPYSNELSELIGGVSPCYFDVSEGVWRCPFTRLPEVIDLLDQRDFHLEKGLKEKVPEAKEERAKEKKKEERKQSAKRQLRELVEQGEEIAFVPAGNAALTRKLKEKGVYEKVKEKNYFGQQVAGIRVPEDKYLEVLSSMDISTDPESLLTELLYDTWQENIEAKDEDRSHSASKYRYMKKGYLLAELCRLAAQQDAYTWGWKQDPDPPPNAPWVLYFQREGSQCSFHSVSGRGEGPDFPGEWDGISHEEFPFKKYLNENADRLFE